MDSFDVIISPKALSQLNDYIDYLQYTLLNDQAAYNVWQDALETREQGSEIGRAAAFKSCRQPKILCPPTAEKERIPRHPLHAAPLPYALPGRGHDSLCGCRIPPAPGL